MGDCRDKDNGGKESSSVTLPLPPAVWPEHSWGQHMLSGALSVLTWSHESGHMCFVLSILRGVNVKEGG